MKRIHYEIVFWARVQHRWSLGSRRSVDRRLDLVQPTIRVWLLP